ncbi:MAG TPA: glutathione S-transferase family protein [Polyangia bacterium]|nr:glutathione S-transferase family protein [Polyangia bacterium]
MKLYYTAHSRAGRPRWMLEEIGEPYELVRLDLRAGEHKLPEYLRIHPHGLVPALVDGSHVFFESSAICMYLADKFSAKKLAPPPGTLDRGHYYQWMVYAMTTCEPPLMQYFLHTMRLPEPRRLLALAQEARNQWSTVAQVLDQALGDRTYFVANHFSAADVMMGSLIEWAQMMGLLSEHPRLDGYATRMKQRPAFQRSRAD